MERGERRPHRERAGDESGDAPDFRAVFETFPYACVLLSRRFEVLAVSDGYVKASMTPRETIVGRRLFDVFPVDPRDGTATGERNMRQSFERVLATRRPDRVPNQRYDIRPEGVGDVFEPRYWSAMNAPVFGSDGEVAYIVHSVEDVTEVVQLKEEGAQREQLQLELSMHADTLKADVHERNAELADANRRLRALQIQLESRIDARNQALRASEDRFARLSASGIFGMAIADLYGMVLEANDAFLELLGYTRAEFAAGAIDGRGLTPPEWLVADDAARAQLRTKGSVPPREKEFFAKDGTRVPVMVAITMLEAPRLVVVVSDLREQKRAEREVRASERRLKQLFDTTQEGVWTIDTDAKTTWVNRRMEEMLGYGPGEMDGKSLFDFMDDEARETAKRNVQRRADGHDEQHEFRFRRKDGTDLWVLIETSPIQEDGRYVGALAMVMDITERRRASEELRLSESRLRQLADSMPQIVWSADAFGKLDYVNERWGAYAGGEAQADLQSMCDAFVHPDDVDAVMREWRASLASGRPYELRHRQRRASDGSYRWQLGRAVPVRDERGAVVKWFGSFTDVDDQVEAAAAIARSNEELERRVRERTAQLALANRELEAFSYSVAHDLRAPLRGMSGFAQVLLEDYGEKLDAAGVESLHAVQANAKRMGEMIDGLLSLSRLTRLELETGAVDLAPMVRAVVRRLASDDPRPGFELVVPDTWVAHVDRRLAMVLIDNLLGNAWKFTKDTPAPRIECGLAPSTGAGSSDGDERDVVYFVRDNGSGFDAAHASKLFAPFQRLHSAREFPGTGIGLATVQRIVHRHGGRIWAEAEVGRGATFLFTLPQRNDRGVDPSSEGSSEPPDS